MSTLTDPQAQANEPMIAMIKELIAPAKISITSAFQAIEPLHPEHKVCSIEINLARGGGYEPHLAPDVFARQYRDAKIKPI